MELDDAFAAELREDVDADARDDTRDDERDGARGDAEVDLVADADGAGSRNGDAKVDDTDAHELSETSRDAVAFADESDADGAAPWDEDEDGNATLAIEVFSMEDVHEIEEPDAPASSGEASAATGRSAVTLFRPVDRQDDLQRISGIGAVTEKALNELGITSYPQLAKLERPEIEKLAEALEIGPERIERDDWVGNARRQLEDVLEEL